MMPTSPSTSPSPAAQAVQASSSPAQPPRWRRRLLLANRRTARTLTETGRYAMLGWIMLGFLSMDPTRPSLRWGLAALSAGWLVALIWWFYNRRGRLDVQREAPRWLTAGRPFQYKMIVTRLRGPRDGWLLRDEQELLPYGEERQMRHWLHQLIDPYRGSRWSVGDTRPTGDDDVCPVALNDPQVNFEADPRQALVRVEGFARRRGVTTLTTVRWGRTDPMGWLQAGHAQTLQPHTMVVVPTPTPMPPWPSPAARRAQQRRQDERTVRRVRTPNGEEWAGLREARPDDPMKHTHWKSWARTGRRWVVEREDPIPARLSIVMDPVLSDTPDALERFERLLEMMAGQALNVRALQDVDWVLIDDEPIRAEGHGVSAWDRVMLKLALAQPVSVEQCNTRWEHLATHWPEVVAMRLMTTRTRDALRPWLMAWEAMGILVEVVDVPIGIEVVQ